MRRVDVKKIRDAVTELCLKANFELRPDVLKALTHAHRRETNENARAILAAIIENAKIASQTGVAICQDTGMVFVHIDLGQNVALVGGDLKNAVNEGVKRAYRKGSLRKSIVDDPILRKNTGTNTPAILVTNIVKGDKVTVEVSPKGFGSENKSDIRMLKPTASIDDIKSFVLDVVRRAGPDACPPLILGVGIGGSFDTVAALAKKALFRSIEKRNPKKHIAKLEKELIKQINSLGIGPMGLGGRTTVLGVNVKEHPSHIAGLPIAVNISCHATRSASKKL